VAEFTWELDAPSGVFKNHQLSQKIREAAIASTKFLQFCEAEPGYGRGKGDTVTIARVKNIPEPANPRFDERDRVPVDTFSLSTVAIQVKYFGRGIEFTEKSQLLANFDIKDKIQRKLKQQMQLSLDTACSAAFKAAQIKFTPTSLTAGSFGTAGAAAATASANFSVSHVKVIRDYMMDTIHVPGWAGGEEYVCLASTKALRGIKNDPEFLEWSKYDRPNQAFMQGEVGKIENVRFVEVNHTNALANNLGTSSVLGEAVVFGDDATAMAVVEDPELRAAIPGNFGLSHAVAWVGLMEFGIVWDTATDGEARIVHVTSL
jgi:N4-gp56 family major capsid protein